MMQMFMKPVIIFAILFSDSIGTEILASLLKIKSAIN